MYANIRNEIHSNWLASHFDAVDYFDRNVMIKNTTGECHFTLKSQMWPGANIHGLNMRLNYRRYTTCAVYKIYDKTLLQ